MVKTNKEKNDPDDNYVKKSVLKDDTERAEKMLGKRVVKRLRKVVR